VTENKYQAGLIQRMEQRFPGCVIIKNDPQYQQGILDLTFLWGRFWAMLEVKAHAGARQQPNQDYWVQRLSDMSFAAFIFPENEEEVLSALEQAFAPRRRTRVSQS
jgi:hypothetical protein